LLGDSSRPHDGEEQYVYVSTPREALRRHFAKWWTVYICGLLILTSDVPNFMSEAPRLRMLELGLCREYYAVHDPSVIGDNGGIPERLCKLPQIQSSVARMRGIMAMMEAIPGLLLAVPFGILADKKGRRLVIGLCLTGFLLRDTWTFATLYFYKVFPLKAVYAAPLTAVIGGGPTVISPMLLAVVAASISAESRYIKLHVSYCSRLKVQCADLLPLKNTSLLHDSSGNPSYRDFRSAAGNSAHGKLWAAFCVS
jgi:hypothetical protein